MTVECKWESLEKVHQSWEKQANNVYGDRNYANRNYAKKRSWS